MNTLNTNYELQYNHRDDTGLKVTGIKYIQPENHPNWSFPLHSHEDALELSLILNGKGSIYYNGKTYQFEQDDLVIKSATALHSEKADKMHHLLLKQDLIFPFSNNCFFT